MDTAKLLYRRLDSLFSALDPKKTQPQQLELFLEEAFAQLKDDLRLKAGLLYSEHRDDFTLAKTVGDPGGRVAESLDPAAGPLQQVFRHRVYIFGDPNAEIAPYRLGLFPLAAAAGLVVGRRPHRHVFFFLLAEGWMMEELDFALNTVRAALGSRLVDARVRGSFHEAAEIQQSLLVEEPPAFPGYQIACRSVPADEVGGVFYGELEASGNLIYVNAGHQPPILFFANPAQVPNHMELDTGGTVIGPLPEPTFRRGFARVRPGEVLVAVTDGILERRDAKGEFFGLERLKAVAQASRALSAEDLLERIFSEAQAFGASRSWDDDATVVVVKRLAKG